MLGKGTQEYEMQWPANSGVSLTGDMRQMHLIGIEEEAFILTLPNNGTLRVFNHGK
jgi:hypothetical protein